MGRQIYNLVIITLIIAGFSVIDFAYAQTITTTPNDGDIVFQFHSIIIDIQSEGQDSIPITIQVKNAAGDDNDFEEFSAEYDPSFWNRHRIIVTPVNKNWDPSKSNDGLIQARDGDTITIKLTDNSGVNSTVTFDGVHEGKITQGIAGDFEVAIECDNDSELDELGIEVGDGICDEWEDHSNPNDEDWLIISDRLLGLDGTYRHNCLDTHSDGCGSDKRDIFVEIDWIDSHKPDPKALEEVQDSFDKHNIRLHLQVNDEPAYGHLPGIAFPGCDNSNECPMGFDQLKSSTFGTAEEQDRNDWVNERYLKHQVFHYALFGHHDESSSTSSGEGEILGNDFVVHLSKFTGKVGSTDQQAGTFMHELGHNLGLHHGGSMFDTTNNKPNLFSVMTYVRQFSDFDQNRNLDYSEQKLGHHHSTDVAQGAWRTATEWAINETAVQGYARGLWAYDEHETEPIIFSCPDEAPNSFSADYLTGAQGGVDWKCDGDIQNDGRFALNVNNFAANPTPPDEYLDGYDEWDTLNFRFSADSDNYASGSHLRMINNELDFEEVTLNRISMLLTLHRQIEMFKNDYFSHGISPYYSPISNGPVSLPAGTSVPGCETTDECYIPSSITIELGTEVIWNNDDTAAHTITSGSPTDGADGIFDSSLIMGGTNYSFVFNDSLGTYPYFCMVHPWMVGEVKVVSAISNDGAYKDSFKAAVRDAIDSINIHDIQKTKEIVQSIDTESQSSLHAKHYNLIQPITENLDGTYQKALGFGFVPTYAELYPPTVSETKIDSMIKKVEAHVAGIEPGIIDCGDPFKLSHGECVCKNPKEEKNSEGDCVPKLITPPTIGPIEVSTDKTYYIPGDTVLISGKVKDIYSGYNVSLQIFAPNGNLVQIDQLNVKSDKQFNSQFNTGGTLGKASGEYTVSVSYGDLTRSVETTFYVGVSSETVPGTDFIVDYVILGGNLISTSPDVDADSLIIAINAKDDGQLTITLPRGLIDAKIGDSDDDFFVLVDGDEVDFKETTTSIDRTLEISFPANSKEIEIIGTFVVPEFGAITALILAVAIMSIIVLSTKSRVFPRL